MFAASSSESCTDAPTDQMADSTIRLTNMSYTYEPLNPDERQIRLITVGRNRVTLEDGSNTFDCSLEAFDFKNVPKYMALSYVWGPSNPCANITINGKLFSVRQNLFDFLQETSWSEYAGAVSFWIDQICIDQQSMAERCDQVAFMDEIYKRASETIIWLGIEEGPSTSHLGDFYWWILENAYWSRLWIIQEICLSPHVRLVYGKSQMSWTDFETGWEEYTAEEISAVKVMSGRRLQQLRTMRLQCQNGISPDRPLVEVVSWFSRRHQCTVPHDEVYAVLSLLHVTQRIPADYTISMECLYRKLIENAWYHRERLSESAFTYVRDTIRLVPARELEQLSDEAKEGCQRLLRTLNDPKHIQGLVVRLV